MPISFSNIPAVMKQPLYWVEVDPSKAGAAVPAYKCLLIGTMSASGTAEADVPIPIGRQMDADAGFGQGSELSRAFKTFFANNFATEVWGLPAAEPTAGTAATGTITVTTVPTEAGTIHLYIGGNHIPVNVAPTDTVDGIAGAIADAITANASLPVSATDSTGGLVNLTCKWKGTSGNDITLLDTYYGLTGGELLPVGIGITYSGATLTGGAGVPVWDNAIANLGEQEFEYVSLGGYTDSTTLLAWETEYGFSDSGRWGWARQHYGHLFAAKRGTYSALLTFGNSRNAPMTSVMGFEVKAPMPAFEWAAAYTAKAARGLMNDPARPLQTLHLYAILPAPGHDRFLLSERMAFATNGIATQATFADGVPQIMRETTTYQRNLYGQSDDAYEVVTTLATLARLIRNQRSAITNKYPRHKLADDGTRYGPGQAIITPKIAKSELIAQYAIDEFNGLVENVRAFKRNLIVERDSIDVNRLNVLYPPDLINQLRTFAVLAQFRLQYNRGIDTEIVST